MIVYNTDKSASREVVVRAVVGPFSIHRPAGFSREKYYKACWCVTATASGIQVTRVRLLGEAKRIAAELATLGDWSWIDPTQCPTELKALAWNVVKETRLS